VSKKILTRAAQCRELEAKKAKPAKARRKRLILPLRQQIAAQRSDGDRRELSNLWRSERGQDPTPLDATNGNYPGRRSGD